MQRPFKYIISGVVAALLVSVVVGCATRREPPSSGLVPHGIAEFRNVTEVSSHDSTRPVVALVLGGGGLRGFAHVGVLRALEELGVVPDIVVGTSAGAVVGAAYASGLTPDQVRSAALGVKVSSLVDLTISSEGLIRGSQLARWIDEVTGGVPIERFPTRFAAVATDLGSGQAVLLSAGSAGSVVQASSAVPGINIPVAYENGHLIDGGASSLIPVRFARAMGADIVIAVDIYCRSARPTGAGAAAVVGSVMHAQSCMLAALEVGQADVLIAPELPIRSGASPEAKESAMRAGYDAAHAAVRNWRARTTPPPPEPSPPTG